MMHIYATHTQTHIHTKLLNQVQHKLWVQKFLHTQKFRSKPSSVFTQVTTCPLRSRQQVSSFDNLPAPSYVSSIIFHSFSSLSTHSHFMRHSSNIDQICCSEKYIHPLLLCSVYTLLCSRQTALIKLCPCMQFFWRSRNSSCSD